MVKIKPVNLVILMASVLIAFTVVEAGFRIYEGEYSFRNYAKEAKTLFHSAYPTEYDAELGWIPKTSTPDKENVRGTTIRVLKHGIRSNGRAAVRDGTDGAGPILAVGDSFTFGDGRNVASHIGIIVGRKSGKRRCFRIWT